MAFLDTTDSQRTLIILASVPVIIRSIVMFLYPGTNPLQTNVFYLILLTLLTIATIYVYYRITA